MTGIHWIRACPWFREPCVLVPVWKGHLSLYREQFVTEVNNFANKLATFAICILISTYIHFFYFLYSTHNRGKTPQLILKCFRLEQHDTGKCSKWQGFLKSLELGCTAMWWNLKLSVRFAWFIAKVVLAFHLLSNYERV